MKRTVPFATAMAIIAAQASVPYHEDINTVGVGKLAAHASSLAKAGDSHRVSLDGRWAFGYTDDARSLPEDMSAMALTDSINVPGNWERQGYGTAIYVNHEFEFAPYKPQPPRLPEAIPAGVYRRDVTIPAEWEGHDIVLKTEGAKGGMYVYVNGAEAGYSEDSKNPAEFDITPYLKKGANTIALKIMRWSTGSYLEAQDFWRVSGLERSVSLEAREKVRTADFRVKSTLDDSYRDGVLEVTALIANTGTKKKKGQTVKMTLSDSEGNTVIEEEKKADIGAGGTASVTFGGRVSEVKRWSAETPYLYDLRIAAGDDTTRAKVGFRRVELAKGDSVLLFNGCPIKLKGVNIHEHNAVTGHYVDEALMKKDFELMKAHNINAVRLCHYPQSDRFYELADSMGLYVYDEANIESHGMYYDLRKGGTLGNNPAWLTPHMDRTRNMFERNKNHASVTVWSLGNEAGNGYNFYQTYLLLKEADKDLMGRPVVYERAQWEWNSDMYVPQYPSTQWLRDMKEKGADRPIVMSEYSHAMGNSNGSLADMWDVINTSEQLQGGFIWDWVDQGFAEKDADGRTYYTYGGDYGKDAPSSGNFNCNGLVGPERQAHPALSEVKYAYQNAGMRLEGNRLTVKNRHWFTTIDEESTVRTTCYAGGRKTGGEELKARIAPQEEATLTLSEMPSGADAIIVAELLDKDGAVTASEKFQLSAPDQTAYTAAGDGDGTAASIEDDGESITATTGRASITVGKKSGAIESYRVDGREYLAGGFGIRSNYWRGPTDNDYGSKLPQRSARWKEENRAMKADAVKATTEGSTARVSVARTLEAGARHRLTYELHGDGTLKIGTELAVSDTTDSKASLPRHGLRLRVGADMNRVEYFGNGPDENYIDRNRGSMPGRYTTTAEEMYTEYVRPQENGHRTGVRYVRLSDGSGRGLTISADSVFEFNALRNSVEDFDGEEATWRDYQWTNRNAREREHRTEDARNTMPRQTHLNDITPRDYVEVCLDEAMQGVGGFDSWGSWPDGPYRLDTGKPRRRVFVLKAE